MSNVTITVVVQGAPNVTIQVPAPPPAVNVQPMAAYKGPKGDSALLIPRDIDGPVEIQATDGTIRCSCSDGAFSQPLPPIEDQVDGRALRFIKVDDVSTGAVTIPSSGAVIPDLGDMVLAEQGASALFEANLTIGKWMLL